MNINKNVQGHLFALTANVMWGLMAPIGKFAQGSYEKSVIYWK